MRLKIILLSALLPIVGIKAQQLISSSGTSFQGTNYNISWSLGELAITSIGGSNYVLTQGFHQPIETETSVVPPISQKLSIQVYPNPVRKMLQINWIKEHFQESILYLFSMEGQLLFTKVISQTENSFEIPMSTYDPGIYILKIKEIHSGYFFEKKIVKQ